MEQILLRRRYSCVCFVGNGLLRPLKGKPYWHQIGTGITIHNTRSYDYCTMHQLHVPTLLLLLAQWLTGTETSAFTSKVHRPSPRASLRPSSQQRSDNERSANDLFESFAAFLKDKQKTIIQEIESVDGSGEKFGRDAWGIFDADSGISSTLQSGGITRVFQGGDVVEKGACSLTVLRGGKLTAERASSIRGRQEDSGIREGDEYAAAALSIVLHTRSPLVPTFRSDVRIFLVRPSSGGGGVDGDVLAWFGGGADLTPYYLFDEDVSFSRKSTRSARPRYCAATTARLGSPTVSQRLSMNG